MKKHLAIFLLVGILIGLTSCTRTPQKYSAYSFDYFNTFTQIDGYAASQAEFDRVSGEILAELGEYHRLYDIYHRYEGIENLCSLNHADGTPRTVRVDARIIDMLLYAKEMYTKTNGRVNIAMGSVLSIWHDYREAGSHDPASAKLPPMDMLREAAAHTDIDCLIIDREASTVTLTDPAMTLDVGAIAKGYAVEMAARALEEKGITGYVLNVGGNIRTVGVKGSGEPWKAGIENPQKDEDPPYLAYLNLSGEALVTSGSYQRYYWVDGKQYHHIIDPDTLMPGETYLSVSVVCPSSADGDALSTALFCMSPDAGLALVESLPEVEAMWVLRDGSRQFSSNFDAYTTD